MQYIPVLQLDDIQEDRPMPSLNHSIVCQNVGHALAAHRDRLSVHQTLNLNLDGWISVPDVCVYRAGTLHASSMSDQNEVMVAPVLVIEVMSPMQNLQPLLDKFRQYHEHGVDLCWVVIPGSRTVTIYPKNAPSSAVSAGNVSCPEMNFEIPIVEIFYGIDA